MLRPMIISSYTDDKNLENFEYFKSIVFNKSIAYLKWDYSVEVNGRTYDSHTIKNFNISGQLQNTFTIGSSLTKSLELELLIEERDEFGNFLELDIPEGCIVKAYAVLLSGYPYIKDGIEYFKEHDGTVLLGEFVATEVDRETTRRIKIKALDAMGHNSLLNSPNISAVLITDPPLSKMGDIVAKIATATGLGFTTEDKTELNKYTLPTFKTVFADEKLTYRTLLEYLAGYCGSNVRITNDNYIKFFKFTDTGVTLTRSNYYTMTKGKYLFEPTGVACTIPSGTTLYQGEGSDSKTIKFTNPFVLTKDDFKPIFDYYCETEKTRVRYYATSADIVGSCLFEPGDIVTIEDHYDNASKVYIQDYKLTCGNGIKESIQCFFDYNKGSIGNSISGKIEKLDGELTKTNAYIEENCVTTTEFDLTVKGINTNIEYANDGLNKWAIEYFRLDEDETQGLLPIDITYDLATAMGRNYTRRELIEDANILVSSRLYDHTLCRFFTGVYINPIPDKDGNVPQHQPVTFRTSEGVNVYINGDQVLKSEVNKGQSKDFALQAGWNIIEIYTGGKIKDVGALVTSFKLKYGNDTEDPFYHLNSTKTQAEKDKEDGKPLWTGKTLQEVNVLKEPSEDAEVLETLPIDSPIEVYENEAGWLKIRQGEEGFGYIPNEHIKQDEVKEPEEEVLYKRFEFIKLINPYAIDVNYKRVTEVERLTTTDSIIDRVSKAEYKYKDEKGNEVTTNGAEYIVQSSSVVQTVNEINQKVEYHEEAIDATVDKMSEVSQTVDKFSLTFSTAIYGNYLSNSAFSTDDPLVGFNYSIPENNNKVTGDVFTFRSVIEAEDGTSTDNTYDENDIELYGYSPITIDYSTPSFENKFKTKGAVKNDSEDAYQSSNRTVDMGTDFKIGQTFYADSENFPYYRDNDNDDFYQFYFAMKAKRSANCVRSYRYNGNEIYLFPRLVISIRADFVSPITLDNGNIIESITIDNIKGLPRDKEGLDDFGVNVDYDAIENWDNYEIDTEWKTIEFITELPKDIFEKAKIESFSVNFETQYWPSVKNSYVKKYASGKKDILNNNVTIEGDLMTDKDGIFICEPMFGTTRDFLPLPYTSKQTELITGVTNITQDGIEISRSDSKLTTEIRNNGMSILYSNQPVAVFKENSLIPELEVTKKLTAPNIFINDYSRALDYKVRVEKEYDENGNEIDNVYYEDIKYGNEIPSEIIIDNQNHYEDMGYWGGSFAITKIAPVYSYFNEAWFALRQYGIIQLDKLTIRVKKDPYGVYPFGFGGGGGDSFHLENLRCGIIEIILEEDVILTHPIVLKNIEGTVRIRGPIEKHKIGELGDAYINGVDGVGRAPMVPGIIAHNVRWLEIYGINFDGGNEFPDYDYDPITTEEEAKEVCESLVKDEETGGWIDTEHHPHHVIYTLGQYVTCNFNDTAFPFTELYSGGSSDELLEELNRIRNKIAIFIGYCNLVDISYCNFPAVDKQTYYITGIAKYDIGILGDHSDCYLSHNNGTFYDTYYKNRDKCWFRIPPGEQLKDPIPTTQPEFPEGYTEQSIDLTDEIFPGGMIAKHKTDGIPLDHCYLGKSRELAYLGSFQYNQGSDISIREPYVIGYNNSGYSRIKNGISLYKLSTLYSNTDGYFFGAASSLPSASYRPSVTSAASYTGYKDLKYTSLYNGQGVSIELPDMKEILSYRELRGARLLLEFETKDGSLVEYGSTTALGEKFGSDYTDPPEGISVRGGSLSDWGYNAGVSFGVRFVYNKDAHYQGSNLRKGYYNMGRSTRAHEILDPFYSTNEYVNTKSINSWAIDENGNSVHTIKNFKYYEGARPFHVGTRCNNAYDGVSYPATEVEIDLGVVTEDWFDDVYKNQYTTLYNNSKSDDKIKPEEFFNTLQGIASGNLKYIDIAPVGVINNTNEGSFPSPLYTSDFSYDSTGETKSTIALSTSCFKIKRARLILETYTDKVAPKSYTLTIKFVDTNGATLKSPVTITKASGTTIHLNEYKNISGYSYESCIGADGSSVVIDSNKEVTLVFKYIPHQYTLTIKYGTSDNSTRFGAYSVSYTEGDSYNVSNLISSPPSTIYIPNDYRQSSVTGAPTSGTITGNLTINVIYIQVQVSTLTVKYILEWYSNGIDSQDEVSVSPTITKNLVIGESYDLRPYIDEHVIKTYNGVTYEFCEFDTDYEINPDGSQGRPTIVGTVKGDIVLKVMYKRSYDYIPGTDMFLPSAIYTGSYDDSFETRSVDMNEAYVGVLSRTNPNTISNTYYYRQSSNGSIFEPVGFATTSYDCYTGNDHNGFEYTFNANTLRSNFKNASNIYLNIKFSKKSYGPTDFDGHDCTAENLYYYIKLTFGKVERLQGIHLGSTDFDDPGLHYAHNCIEIDNKNNKPSILTCSYYFGTLKEFDRFDSAANDLTPFVVSGCSSSSTATYTQKIKLNDIVFPTPWKDTIDGWYNTNNGYAYGIDTDTFTNVVDMVRKGKLLSVQIYPTDFHYGYESYDDRPDPTSHQCLKILEVKLTTE